MSTQNKLQWLPADLCQLRCLEQLLLKDNQWKKPLDAYIEIMPFVGIRTMLRGWESGESRVFDWEILPNELVKLHILGEGHGGSVWEGNQITVGVESVLTRPFTGTWRGRKCALKYPNVKCTGDTPADQNRDWLKFCLELGTQMYVAVHNFPLLICLSSGQ